MGIVTRPPLQLMLRPVQPRQRLQQPLALTDLMCLPQSARRANDGRRT